MPNPTVLNQQFQQFTRHPALVEVGDLNRKAFVILNGFHGIGALENFQFSMCVYDNDVDVLYAVIKPHMNVGIEDGFFLTRDDLNDLQISIDELRDLELEQPYRDFFDLLEFVVDRSIREMTIHEKTVRWVKSRYHSVSDDADKKSLLLSACTL